MASSLVLIACELPAGKVSEDPACSAAKVPALIGAAPYSMLNKLFFSYAENSTAQSWSSGDGGSSIPLPDDRNLWMFGDSILGPLNLDKTYPKSVKVVPNSFIVQEGGRLSMVFPRPNSSDLDISVPGQNSHEEWFWPRTGTVSDDTVEIILGQIRRSGDHDSFGFTTEKSVLARLSLPDLRVLDLIDLPNTVPELQQGAAILEDGNYKYIYGVYETKSHQKNMIVARVRGTSLRGTWEYFAGGSWSRMATDVRPVMDDVGASYGITKIGRFYTLIMIVPFEPEIYAYFSCSPTGPFANKTPVYRTPESGRDGTYHREDLYSYNVYAHPEFSRNSKVIISYSVNGTGFPDHDPTVYRPRWVELTFKAS
jgi:hypothetical protein